MAEPESQAVADAPLYLRVAAALREELAQPRVSPGTRLPSERTLARRHHVNRQTVRSALRLLREERLVVTDRRGTFAAGAPEEAVTAVPALAARRPVFPGGPPAAGAQVRATLTWEVPPAHLAGRLLLAPGEATLVHRQVVLGPQGTPLQRAVSWFSRPALTEIPQLGRYRRGRDRHRRPDLRLLYHWMHQAGLRLTHRESVGVSSVPAGETGTEGAGAAARLLVHRVVNDQHGHALEITDIDFSARSAAWTYEFSA